MQPEAKLKIRYTDAKRHAGGDGDNPLRKYSQYEHFSKTV
ncbi:Uncharacterised protein [Serratia grimesii]|jgi:hypothetical protein|nr:Uncharacterised protein [Serratia grimesii]CAI1500456.1 Uncharacterised protein [Serratia grimesii]CAI2786433.1 Uncharacterised protein [Serratia grimesii]CUW05844.1 Uncharacterised protein [Serratia grimesii]SMZ55535.1 Uncharacterised protein [Serratia grimesii]